MSVERALGNLGKTVGLIVIMLAWQWSQWLSDWLVKLDPALVSIVPWVKGIALVAMTAIVLIRDIPQFWLRKPATHQQVENRRSLINTFLENAVEKYGEVYRAHYHRRLVPKIRVNIMLPTVRWKLWAPYIRMYDYYYSSDPQYNYTYSAQHREWGKYQGACGLAWAEADVTGLYDTVDPRYNTSPAAVDLGGTINAIKCVASKAICYNGKVVGVLNFDSVTDNMNVTHFDDRGPITVLINTYIEQLGVLLFEDGVEEEKPWPSVRRSPANQPAAQR